MAALTQQADIVALSFSAAYPARRVAPLLGQLREMLPERIEIWAGGAGSARVAAQAGIVPITDMARALNALQEWRTRHAT
jgi:methylmalonyl-CoA mutase cobalamin-binding subunit